MKSNSNCRICNFPLYDFIDLGEMPISNNFYGNKQNAINATKFPLKVLYCKHCLLGQTSVVIPPNVLYENYSYCTGISNGYAMHVRELATLLKEKYSLNEKSFHVDIAGNDGTLLREFKSVLNHEVLNVDPAKTLIEKNIAAGVRHDCNYWTEKYSHEMVEKYGYADLITATNVLAHVDDVTGFMLGVEFALKENGILIIEVPYISEMVWHNEFDTIYHEHLSYFSITALNELCIKSGLKIIDVEFFKLHGGSIRATISRIESSHRVNDRFHDYIMEEPKFNLFNQKFSENAEFVKNRLMTVLLDVSIDNKKVAAFGACAKGNILLNYCGITDKLVEYIIDQTPLKIWKFSAGTGIPVLPIDEFLKRSPDYILILAWNFKEEIIEKLKSWGYKGKFIVPIPEVTII